MSTDPFSSSVLNHNRIASIDFAPGQSGAIAINDQLIVRQADSTNPAFEQAVHAFNNAATVATTLTPAGIFGTSLLPPADDYVVVEVDGLHKLKTDIFHLVDHLRATYFAGREYDVSTNHVVIPSPLGGVGCPFGPPFPTSRWEPPPPPSGSGSERQPVVTVVDSGYQDWWGDKTVVTTLGEQFGPWGENPLGVMCNLLPINLAKYLSGTKSSLTPASLITRVNGSIPAATLPAGPGFNTPPSFAGDVPAANVKNLMDAMAGHANFVAGVIAQGCDYPTIDIWSHTSAFVTHGDFSITTEAAVALSVVQSQDALHKALLPLADVINVGFAFPLRADGVEASNVKTDFISGLWSSMIRSLSAIYSSTSPPTSMPMIVAPAGNEGATLPYFPAALNQYFSSRIASYAALANPASFFENVIGVGSLGPKERKPFTYDGAALTNYHFGASDFSNNGDWVTCSAIGENVQSAFMPIHHYMTREEDQKQDRVKVRFPYPAAMWNGTSFAAPRVSAAIAARAAHGLEPMQAWQALVTATGTSAAADGVKLGVRFDNL